MKAIKIIGIAFLSVIIIALIAIAILPNEYNVKTKVLINKPVYMVYNKVADFSTWKDWSVWYKYDIDAKYGYEGNMGEIGSKMTWSGDTVGVGYQELTQIVRNKSLISKLVFTYPYEASSDVAFHFAEIDGKTEVTWINKGEYGFGLQRIMGYFFLGQLKAQFQEGLNNLKKWVESLPTESNLTINEVNVESQKYYYIEESSPNQPEIISEKLSKAYEELNKFAHENAIIINGAPFAITLEWTNEGMWKFRAGIPVDRNDITPKGRIKSDTTYTGKAVRAIYIGSYDGAAEAYQKIDKYVTEKKYNFSWYSWEVYVSNPSNTPADRVETHIYFPVK